MKFVFKGASAGAAALLLSAGLGAAPAGAADACRLDISGPTPTSVTEGDAASGPTLTYRITATNTAGQGNANACNGVTATYAFSGDAELNADYTTPDARSVSFDAGITGGNSDFRDVVVTVVGDDLDEVNETVVVTISAGTGAPTLGVTTATGTIIDDDEAAVDPGPDPLIGAGGTAAITPTAGPAGTKITVTGTKCTGTTGSAALVRRALDPTTEDDAPVATGTATPGEDDTFTVELTVPEGLDPNRSYYVFASCNGADSGASYEQKPEFDVTATATGTGTGDGTDTGNGYRMVAADGGIFTFGDRQFWGSTGNIRLNQPIVGGATDISDYEGYWIVARDGGVFAFDAEFHGSLGGANITSPAVEIEPTPTGKGYWIVQADGTVTPYGNAKHYGDMKGKALNKPMIGMAVTPTGEGYWLVSEDGGIFNFGDADFFGSTGAMKLNAPIIDLAPAADNNGYYLLGSDGGVFTFGSAEFKGSTGDIKLNAPVVAMLVNPTGAGYWLAASDGGIFTFGAVEFLGSMGGTKLNSPVLDLIN